MGWIQTKFSQWNGHFLPHCTPLTLGNEMGGGSAAERVTWWKLLFSRDATLCLQDVGNLRSSQAAREVHSGKENVCFKGKQEMKVFSLWQRS